MVTKRSIFAALLLYYISGVDTTDILNGLKLSKYSIVKPQVVHRFTRSINRPPEAEQSFHEGESVSYALTIKNRKHILHLKRNRDFLSPDFVHYHKEHNHCYYHGEVEGYENSVVVLSTCSGLRGVILLGNDAYGLEPVSQSATSDHILYLLKDVQSEPATCGVVGEAASTHNHSHFEPGQSLTSLLRKKRSLPETSYVELVLVADNLRYNFKKQNETAVREEMVQLANLLDGYYKPLNIRVVLVGVEIFKTSNPFSVDGPAGDVLSRFVKWRKGTLLSKIRNDNAQLIVGQPRAYEGGVLGMAFVGTVCSVATSGGISVFSDNNLPYFSTVVAHEMGHNMGMNHDADNCVCKTGSCIMSSTATGSTTFSSCSDSYFETLVLRGGGLCLKNQPSLSDVVSIPKCGNGLLEKGEQCDCGTPEECKNDCCHAATCKLTNGAACAHGSCCSNCQIKVPGTPCRNSLNTCDLPEFCDGKSSFCPDDFYIMDGLTCENNAAYCYEGRCQTYDYQCRHLFAPDPAIKAANICFLTANVRGNRFGNCGRNGKTFIPCRLDNAMCGKVQCTNVDANNPPNGAQVTTEIIQGATCVNADFHVGTDMLDPAYVNPGSPCAAGKTCLDFACVNASALLSNLDCNAQTTCHSRGVCNNQGHCHCEDGWAPPFCDKSGFGGSIDSGPAQIDYSLRNGLLIFFLLVVPILILVTLVLLYFFRRESLDPCLKKRHLPSRNPRHKQPNSNFQSNTTIQQPPQAPPPRPPYPSEVTPPQSGYEDFDYWSEDLSVATPNPEVPKQGPGVPKPIPPKKLPV